MSDRNLGVRKRNVDPEVVQVALLLVMGLGLDDDMTARNLIAELLESGREFPDTPFQGW